MRRGRGGEEEGRRRGRGGGEEGEEEGGKRERRRGRGGEEEGMRRAPTPTRFIHPPVSPWKATPDTHVTPI